MNVFNTKARLKAWQNWVRQRQQSEIKCCPHSTRLQTSVFGLCRVMVCNFPWIMSNNSDCVKQWAAVYFVLCFKLVCNFAISPEHSRVLGLCPDLRSVTFLCSISLNIFSYIFSVAPTKFSHNYFNDKKYPLNQTLLLIYNG